MKINFRKTNYEVGNKNGSVLYGYKNMEFIERYYTRWGKHTYNGSLIRHYIVEKLIDSIRDWFNKIIDINIKNKSLKKVMYSFITMLYGFNCNFKPKNIFTYMGRWIFG
jgi:hypothetical protein